MLVAAAVFAAVVLLMAAVACRRRGSWIILFLTFLAIPVAVFISFWAAGFGHPSGRLDLAKALLPYMVLPFTLGLVTEDNSAAVICVWVPVLQMLAYGVNLASGFYRNKLLRGAGWLLALHVIASVVYSFSTEAIILLVTSTAMQR